MIKDRPKGWRIVTRTHRRGAVTSSPTDKSTATPLVALRPSFHAIEEGPPVEGPPIEGPPIEGLPDWRGRIDDTPLPYKGRSVEGMQASAPLSAYVAGWTTPPCPTDGWMHLLQRPRPSLPRMDRQRFILYLSLSLSLTHSLTYSLSHTHK